MNRAVRAHDQLSIIRVCENGRVVLTFLLSLVSRNVSETNILKRLDLGCPVLEGSAFDRAYWKQ